MPTPSECATGAFNGHWPGGADGRFADCLGVGGHVVHYVGGFAGDDTWGICGTIVEQDEVVTGLGWLDPNLCPPASAPPGPAARGRAFRPAVAGRKGVVASGSRLASAAGLEILERGGNAIDAAAATVFALGVTRPQAAGVGGNGFLVYRRADGRAATLDFEAAIPAAVTAETFAGDGIHREGTGHRVVGVPGTVAGMAAALRRFGTIGMADAIAPAERLAYGGVPVSDRFASDYKAAAIGSDHDLRLARFPAAAAIYLRHGLQYPPDNPRARSILVQRDQARTLALVARFGARAFYRDGDYPAFVFGGHRYAAGPSVARLIADDMRASQRSPYSGDAGVMTLGDLAGYEAKWRAPLRGSYRGRQIVTVGPPDAGGTFLLETLNILEGYDVAELGHGTADHLHLLAEAQKIAWADRSAYSGDPDFVDVPSFLTSKDYAAQRRAEIDMTHARCFGAGEPGASSRPCDGAESAEGGSTAHISVIDAHGNAVAVTFSISQPFGSAVVAPGTGFLLNSNIDDFPAAGSPGAVVGGRRMARSPVTPAIVVEGQRPIAALGGAGGAGIPPGMLQAVSNIIDFGLPLDRALDAARTRELECCAMQLEDTRLRPEAIDELADRGHAVTRLGEYSLGPLLHAVGADPSGPLRRGASDSRDEPGAVPQK